MNINYNMSENSFTKTKTGTITPVEDTSWIENQEKLYTEPTFGHKKKLILILQKVVEHI